MYWKETWKINVMKNIQIAILSWLHIQYLTIKQHGMLSLYYLLEDP